MLRRRIRNTSYAKHMKTVFTAFAIAAVALLGSTTQAEARSHKAPASYTYISGYRSCGTPIYTQKYFIGYDHCGRPLWGYRIVSPPRYHRAPEPRYDYPVRGGHGPSRGSCR